MDDARSAMEIVVSLHNHPGSTIWTPRTDLMPYRKRMAVNYQSMND
jgi:hypothetical protein